ncbi:MAG: hypothetical protein KC620_19920 [Myxococcales bacterium]|nr:hypothetical protein [Myxococcales bacterium]
MPEDSPAERQAEAVEARIGTGDVRSLVGDLANGHGVALDPDQVTRAFDAKNHELNGWKTTLTARVITNGTTVVQAFHQLGEQAQWNVQSFSSLEANVVATILTAVGFIPVVGTAASLIGSIFYNIYSTAQSNAALRAAMSDASGAMMSAVAQQGQVSLHALGTLDTEHTRLLTLAETARNAGDVAAINAVHPDDGFIETVRQGDVYQRLAREWMLRNTATDYELTSANRFYSRDGVDHDAWQQVRDGSGMSMANQGNELLAGQVRGTLARFGITPDSPVEASDFDRYSRFNGRIADQRRFCSSFSAGSTLRSVYCSGLYFNESWQLRAAFRVQEGLAVNGTRSLDEGWVQHGSAIREDTRGNEANCKEVDFGS